MILYYLAGFLNDGILLLMQKWKKIDSKVILAHPRLRVVQDQVQLPDGSVTDYVRYDGYKSAVSIFTVKDGEVLMQREYSYPSDEVLQQIPCGAIEPGETPEAAARRELQEEAGYSAAKLELIGSHYINNRRTDARLYVYVATDVTECEKTGGDPEESIEPFWMPLSSLRKAIVDGEIDHPLVLTAWALFEARQKS